MMAAGGAAVCDLARREVHDKDIESIVKEAIAKELEAMSLDLMSKISTRFNEIEAQVVPRDGVPLTSRVTTIANELRHIRRCTADALMGLGARIDALEAEIVSVREAVAVGQTLQSKEPATACAACSADEGNLGESAEALVGVIEEAQSLDQAPLAPDAKVPAASRRARSIPESSSLARLRWAEDGTPNRSRTPGPDQESSRRSRGNSCSADTSAANGMMQDVQGAATTQIHELQACEERVPTAISSQLYPRSTAALGSFNARLSGSVQLVKHQLAGAVSSPQSGSLSRSMVISFGACSSKADGSTSVLSSTAVGRTSTSRHGERGDNLSSSFSSSHQQAQGQTAGPLTPAPTTLFRGLLSQPAQQPLQVRQNGSMMPPSMHLSNGLSPAAYLSPSRR